MTWLRRGAASLFWREFGSRPALSQRGPEDSPNRDRAPGNTLKDMSKTC